MAVERRLRHPAGGETPGPGVRLTYPLVREGGRLVRATWDEALDRVAAGLSRIREQYGGDGFGLFSSSKATNELNYLAGKFARQVMGSNNVDSCNRT
ncbi:formate dehydrogenase [Limnochorda pilosa]|uniref:Formate dehydrogenase n=3 Tax=Limnochorda pilosa TaxID=1555112 RepID=A0A0K2SHX6_LIMPI|nr:formate dehydrogenase [Limnochorda pilosa]